ncbi:MAG: DUF2071 domain-containing protein [Planctomycetota bacterium]
MATLPSDIAQTNHRPYPLPDSVWSGAMSWHDLLFMHYPVDASFLRPLIPSELEVDCFDGKAWVSVVPFRMSRVGPRYLNRVPYVSAFPELNLRTYVSAGGRGGVWFFSLDAARLLAVVVARALFRLPYFWARMSCQERDGWIDFRSLRIHPGATPLEFVGRYRGVGEIEETRPGTLDHWLTERYCLYSGKEGRVFRGEIHHLPWPIQKAEVELERDSVLASIGLESTETPILQFARRIDVVAWNVQPVGESDGAPR